VFQTKVVEKIKTDISCSITFFKNRTVLEIMWKYSVEPDRPRITIWRMHIAYWMPKAKYTHPEFVILIAYPSQQWLYERASILSYTYFTWHVDFCH